MTTKLLCVQLFFGLLSVAGMATSAFLVRKKKMGMDSFHYWHGVCQGIIFGNMIMYIASVIIIHIG